MLKQPNDKMMNTRKEEWKFIQRGRRFEPMCNCGEIVGIHKRQDQCAGALGSSSVTVTVEDEETGSNHNM